MAKLVLLRHGQSHWNRENRFTGWTDVNLTEQGISEAHWAGETLRRAGLQFDIAVTSVLVRAVRTLWIVLDELDQTWVPEIKDWRLNERHYGALQGFNKAETAERMGAEKVYAWRRSFDGRPPALEPDDPRHPVFDRRYAGIDPHRLPATESLKDTLERALPCWEDTILPRLRSGLQVLVVAHGNSLRALVKYLNGIADEAIPDVNIPTGIPLMYEFNDQMNISRREYLAEPDMVVRATEAVRRDIEKLKKRMNDSD